MGSLNLMNLEKCVFCCCCCSEIIEVIWAEMIVACVVYDHPAFSERVEIFSCHHWQVASKLQGENLSLLDYTIIKSYHWKTSPRNIVAHFGDRATSRKLGGRKTIGKETISCVEKDQVSSAVLASQVVASRHPEGDVMNYKRMHWQEYILYSLTAE